MLVRKQIKDIYIKGDGPMPQDVEFSYDCRNGSLAGFLAAGGDSIQSRAGYGFDSGGVYISSNNYDDWFVLFCELPDLTQAKTITLKSNGYYIAGSWSNNKRIGIGEFKDWNNMGTTRLEGDMAFNSSSPGSYNGYGLRGRDTWFQRERVCGNTGDTEATLTIDLTTGGVTFTNTGANTKTYTTTLSSAQIEQLKTWKYAFFQKEEGYQYRSERLHEVYYKVEY